MTTLYSFCSESDCPDGAAPSGLIQATDGNFYGTTNEGAIAGTVFKITPTGTLTTLHSFCSQTNCADGGGPAGVLAEGTDGSFYGETSFDGANGDGTLFRITPQGVLRTLHSFDNPFQGGYVALGGTQATNGNFYGATIFGGTSNSACFTGTCGTIFRLSVGLGPFVETVPDSGKAGSLVKILGSDLTGATGVSFNGAAAVFTVVSKTLISATVPTGATTGFVTVTVPSGTLKSNVKFQVRP